MSRWRLRRDGPVDEREQFTGAVREACMRMGLVVLALEADRVVVQGRIDGTVALEDVRAACALVPPQEWTGVVLDALQGLALALEVPVDLADGGTVRPLLRVRVQAEGAVLAEDVVARPLCDGLVEVLVAEVAGAVRLVPPALVQRWGSDEDELLALGRTQVLRAGLLERRPLDLEGVLLTVLEGSSAFAGTHVRWLSTYVDVPPAGALVALPTRHVVLVAPMHRRGEVLDAAQALLVNADRLWREGPGALSPDLWWWRPDAMLRLPGSPTSLSPPAAVLEVLDALDP